MTHVKYVPEEKSRSARMNILLETRIVHFSKLDFIMDLPSWVRINEYIVILAYYIVVGTTFITQYQ